MTAMWDETARSRASIRRRNRIDPTKHAPPEIESGIGHVVVMPGTRQHEQRQVTTRWELPREGGDVSRDVVLTQRDQRGYVYLLEFRPN
jgi:hypothetical protein